MTNVNIRKENSFENTGLIAEFECEGIPLKEVCNGIANILI